MKKLLFCLLMPFALQAQTLPDSTTRKIDSIFRYYTTSTPGCAVAVSLNGAVVFQKGYGLANMEYAIPVVPNTIFHIASESKQYVAFCMLLLEKEGKLSIDDDIRKHLDYMHDFGQKITIRHLIHHTSGLRDQWQLLANAGFQLDDVITQDHIVKLVSKQRALNFNPGEEHMYCNTGYTLMAEIVKKVSGLTLRQYAEKNIFQPLGMKDTHFHDNYTELVPGRAYSYSPQSNGKFQHSVLSYSNVGATSLFTTVLDELKWLNNYETGAVGGKDLIEKMYQAGVLNDGRKLTYAFAVNMGKYKGWQQIGHGGGDAGFRTYACRFPEKGLGVVVFSNHGAANPTGLTNQVADVFLPGAKEEPKKEEVYVTDSTLLKKIPGRYYTERGDQVQLVWQNGKLSRRNINNGSMAEVKLVAEGNDRYKASIGGVLIFDKKNLSQDSIMEFKVEHPNIIQTFKRQPPVEQKLTSEFAGKYFDASTEAYYYINYKDGQLSIDHRKYPSGPLKYIAPDQFTTPHWWMFHIKFIRDKQKKVVGFEVNSGRIVHLRYDKVQ